MMLQMVHVLSSAPETWKGAKGFITPELMKEHFAKPGDNVKILVCGPPPQVAAIAGAKDGMKQGDLKGALKELGYTPEQVFKF
jgi:cytochrome-b5 reductase